MMVCVNETATAPRDMLVSRLPSVCTTASGSTLRSCRGGRGGGAGGGGRGWQGQERERGGTHGKGRVGRPARQAVGPEAARQGPLTSALSRGKAGGLRLRVRAVSGAPPLVGTRAREGCVPDVCRPLGWAPGASCTRGAWQACRGCGGGGRTSACEGGQPATPGLAGGAVMHTYSRAA